MPLYKIIRQGRWPNGLYDEKSDCTTGSPFLLRREEDTEGARQEIALSIMAFDERNGQTPPTNWSVEPV
jgi:hypothetical protein